MNPTNKHTRPWADNKKLKVINFFGGPGTGKSTCAADLYSLMKKRGYKVELIHEIAKDFVWERWDHIFREQDYIFAHQHRLQRRLVGHDIDYVIVDSSLILGLFYMPDDFPPSFKQFIQDVYNSYSNINIYLLRSDAFEYVPEGRNQTEEEAKEIDQRVLEYLLTEEIDFYTTESGDDAAAAILHTIKDLASRESCQ